MTWLRGWSDVTWLESGESGNLARVVARAWSGLTLLYNQVVILNIRCLKQQTIRKKKMAKGNLQDPFLNALRRERILFLSIW